MYPCNKKQLPTISMYAGATKVLHFPVTNPSGNSADLTNCTARLTAVNSAHKNSRPAIILDGVVSPTASDVFLFTMEPKDTIEEEGKYIYQVWIVGSDGKPEEPQQGELYITKNIDKTFI